MLKMPTCLFIFALKTHVYNLGECATTLLIDEFKLPKYPYFKIIQQRSKHIENCIYIYGCIFREEINLNKITEKKRVYTSLKLLCVCSSSH